MNESQESDDGAPNRQRELIEAAVRQAEEARQRANATVSTPPADSTLATLAPDSIVGYRIVRELHRGGQGVVYEAFQESTRRKVAIKVMKEGPFAGAADEARFDREVQVLGQLNHPNIVTIHDSGSSAGHHYFVMDYVPGQSLDAYMASARPSIDESLRLFARVCDAVNAAHLRGVIHRDLKPGNVRIDTEGEPRVLDFGLAKVATTDSDVSAMTMTGQFVGSLPWASPEQAEAVPSKIDVRTDVYSLGVILYHMLTGKFPYNVIGNVRDVLDNILTAEPTRPSTLRGEGERLARRINDEVETIVLKCLHKERERRYQTAGELARDVKHYLNGEPIEAKRDSLPYVLRKRLKRHKLAVGFAAGLLAVVTAGFVISLTFWRQAVEDRDLAQVAEAKAQRRFDDVRELANAVMFDFHDMIVDLEGSTPVREFLVKTALEYLDDLATEVADDPSLQRELAHGYIRVGAVQGNPYVGNLGDTEGALASYRKAEELLGALSAADPTDAVARDDLAYAHQGLGLMLETTGRPMEALAGFRRAGEIYEALSAAEPTDTEVRLDLAFNYRYVASMLVASGQNDEALAEFLKSLRLLEALHAADPDNAEFRRGLAFGHEGVGDMQVRMGQAADALDSRQKSLELFETLSAADPDNATLRRDVYVAYQRLGHAQAAVGLTDEAWASFRKFQQLCEAAVAADPANVLARDDLGNCYSSIGGMLASDGQTDDALASLRKSLEVREAMLVADPTNARTRYRMAADSREIADILIAAGRTEESVASYRKSLENFDALLAADPNNARAQRNAYVSYQKLGNALADMGRPEEALAAYREFQRMCEALRDVVPSDVDVRRDLAVAYGNTANVLAEMDDHEGAMAGYQKALEVFGGLLADNPTDVAGQRDVVQCYEALGAECARCGARQGAPSEERLGHWRHAREWYQRSLSIWGNMRERGTLAAPESGMADEIMAEIAKCDAAIAGLEQNAEAEKEPVPRSLDKDR